MLATKMQKYEKTMEKNYKKQWKNINNVVEAIRNEVSIVKVLSERLDSIQSDWRF